MKKGQSLEHTRGGRWVFLENLFNIHKTWLELLIQLLKTSQKMQWQYWSRKTISPIHGNHRPIYMEVMIFGWLKATRLEHRSFSHHNTLMYTAGASHSGCRSIPKLSRRMADGCVSNEMQGKKIKLLAILKITVWGQIFSIPTQFAAR